MKGKRLVNYIPHNKFVHVNTKGDDYEDYLINLSNTVTVACDKFFERRGIISVNPFASKANDEEKNKRSKEAMQMAWKIAKEELDKKDENKN